MKLTVLAYAALLGLTACGGSGGSGGLNYDGGANNNGSNNNGANSGGANNGNANNNGGSNIGGGSNLNNGGDSNNNSIAPAPAPSPSQSYDGVVIPGEIDNGGKTPTQTISSNNFDKITVNGIDITLKREGISAGTFTRITQRDETTVVSGNYLSYMRFGSYTDVNHNNNPNFNPAYVFALGSVTPQADMPKSGKATYSGLALASPIGGVYEEGTSTFNVDFGTKKLNGSVSVGRWNPVSLTAKIDGNQFSGTSAEGIKPQVASMARKRPNWAACSIVKCPATMQA
jgi:hypothetical protein